MLLIGAPVWEGSQRYRSGPDRFLSPECGAPDGQRADGRPARPPYEHRFCAGRQPPYRLPNARNRDGCSRLRAAPEWTLGLGFSRAGFFGPASAVVSDGAAGASPTIATDSAAHHIDVLFPQSSRKLLGRPAKSQLSNDIGLQRWAGLEHVFLMRVALSCF